MTHETPVGATTEWYTPPELFERLGLTFDLDPASPLSGPVAWVPAKRFYSPADDGLAQPWEGRVWLNPPYGPTAPAFIRKMVEHRDGLLLIPARTETRAFQHAAARADAVCFMRDRLHHIREDGFQARSSFASVLMAFGAHSALTLRDADLGWMVLQKAGRCRWSSAHSMSFMFCATHDMYSKVWPPKHGAEAA